MDGSRPRRRPGSRTPGSQRDHPVPTHGTPVTTLDPATEYPYRTGGRGTLLLTAVDPSTPTKRPAGMDPTTVTATRAHWGGAGDHPNRVGGSPLPVGPWERAPSGRRGSPGRASSSARIPL